MELEPTGEYKDEEEGSQFTSIDNEAKPGKLTAHGTEVLNNHSSSYGCKEEELSNKTKNDSLSTDIEAKSLDQSATEQESASVNKYESFNDSENNIIEEAESFNRSVNQASPSHAGLATCNAEENDKIKFNPSEKLKPTANHNSVENEVSDSSSPKPPPDAASSPLSQSTDDCCSSNHVQISPEAGEENELLGIRDEKETQRVDRVDHLSPISEVAADENPSVKSNSKLEEKSVQESNSIDVKQKIPTPVFEDITDDDDSDADTAGVNIELELDDLIEPSEISADKATEKLINEPKVSSNRNSPHESDNQIEEAKLKQYSPSCDTEEAKDLLDKTTKSDFTHLKVKLLPKQKVTARKSGKPVSQSQSSILKTINLHPIKDITMNVSEVEDALYLSKSSADCQDSKETSSTENSVSIHDIKPFLGGRKKRRKKSYDLPGCTRKRIKKIRSDAESIGSSADSMSLADSVSDGDFQESESHKESLGLTYEAVTDKANISSQAPFAPKVESALDILTKNAHLGFAKKPKLHSSSSPSVSSLSILSSRKQVFPPYKVGATAKKAKMKSVLDMLYRRSQQKAESTPESEDVVSSSVTSTVSSISENDNSSSSLANKNGSGTTTTTICVTSSESSTTTTIMVSPNKPVVEGMKRKGTPRKRKEEVICLSDSDDSDGKSNSKGSNEGKKKRDVSLNGTSNVPPTNLTTPSKGHSPLIKSRPLTSSAPGSTPGSAPAPVVMVVAQHSTAAGMRSLLPQHTLLQASAGLVQGGKVVKPSAGSNLLPLYSTIPIGAKAVNIANLPAGMTAVPMTSLGNMASTGSQQTVTLFGPISGHNAAGATVPLSGANIVNISGSKHLVVAPAPLQAQPGGKFLTNKNTTSLLPSLSPLPSPSVKSQILLAGPMPSLSSTTKLSTGSNKTSPSILPASTTSSPSNLESLRALLVGKPIALNPVSRSLFSSSVANPTASSLLPSTPMLFQMITTSGTSLVPITAQPLTLTSASLPQFKHVQQHQQHSLLKNPSSSTLLVAANRSATITSSKLAVNGSSSSLIKPNVPNGVACLTPPKTPDNDTALEAAAAATLSKHVANQADTSDIIPLCCCKISGASFPKLTTAHTYCQALDTVDNKVLGCFNKVTNSVLVRPGVKIPFMAMCEAHRRNLKLHRCCPGCGHFCVQGQFQLCQGNGKESEHTFHKQCAFYRGGKNLCPHCGASGNITQVELKLSGSDGVVSDVTVPSSLQSQNDLVVRKVARMGGRSIRKSKSTYGAKQETLTLPNNKEIDISAIPLGPDQQVLTKLSKCAMEDRPKKYRSMTKDLYTPAFEGDVEKVFYLLMDGMDPNQRYEEQEGQTAMHAAATSGSIGTVVLLQQFGGEIHAQDKSLRTPMMCAAEGGNLEVVKFLDKAGAKVEDRGEDGMTSLHYAAKAGYIDIVQYILSTQRLDVNIEDDGGWTPIIWATESQLLDVVKFLIKHGGDPNKKDNEENTGLHWAAFSGSLDISEVFLDLGCELDSPNEHGDRPLHIAARQDHYDIVVLLLARGANVNLKNNKDETPVECCINQSSQVCMALKVNQKLRGFAAHKLIHPERLVERDITMGREKNPIACVNSEDDEPCPTDYLYVTQNVETSWLNINCVITSLQSCRCKDDCSSMYCVCSRSSIRCWYDKMGRLVEEINLLEPPLLFECNRACRCLINCNNRVVQNGITCRLQMFRTNGRGWGVRTLMDIPKGTFVCEYVGELISDSEADIREDDSYLFDLDNKDGDTYCIDARKYGNISRFINHLCEPNLVPVKVFVEHQDLRFPRICLFSSKDIAAYEELGFDYGEKFWMIKWKFFTCACKSSKCKYSSDTIHKTLEDYKLRYPDEQVD